MTPMDAAEKVGEAEEMTDTDSATLELLCPRGHAVATLTKQARQQTEISLTNAAPERWPRERDDDYTRMHCQQCNPPEWLAGPTGALRSKVSQMIDESKPNGSFTLSLA